MTETPREKCERLLNELTREEFRKAERILHAFEALTHDEMNKVRAIIKAGEECVAEEEAGQ